MRLLDAHCHVFEYLSSYRGEGEIRAIGGGKARWANGQIVSMMPPELGDKGFETETLVKFLKEKGVEKAVLLQGSFYGFHNEYEEYEHVYPQSGQEDGSLLWLCRPVSDLFLFSEHLNQLDSGIDN